MRVESRVLSVSWVPSDVVTGASRLSFVLALSGADEPPPDVLVDAEPLLAAGRIRQANELRAWVEFDEAGCPAAWDYAKAPSVDQSEGEFPVLRHEPQIS